MMNQNNSGVGGMDFQRFPQNGGMSQNGGMAQRQDMQEYQQKQEQMRQQQIMQQMAMAQTSQQVFSTASRMVASRGEAEAVIVDFTGALMVFYDMAHDCFYTKRWDNASNSVVFNEYPRSNGQQNDQSALAQDVQTLFGMVESLMQDVDLLKRPNNQNRKGNESK